MHTQLTYKPLRPNLLLSIAPPSPMQSLLLGRSLHRSQLRQTILDLEISDADQIDKVIAGHLAGSIGTIQNAGDQLAFFFV